MTRIVLADDHTLVRSGIRALLERMQGMDVVAEAANGVAAVAAVAEHDPDIALVNISMPELNGIEATRRIVNTHPRTRVIVMSLHTDQEYVRRAFLAGAVGYVAKSANREELELAIRAASRGSVWIDPAISQTVVDALIGGKDPGTFELLTPRQREVLKLIAEGASTKAIARRLGVSVKTIESHRAQLMKRLDVDGVAGLVRAAIRIGISDPRST
jgi:DNA-binding NarL/FixJ family response regulator